MPGENSGSDVVVVGGGIIGLSIAWHLAKEGVAVTVLERGQVGGQASGAAAGMLAPLAEASEPGPFVTLGLESLRRYPSFVSELNDETGMDAELIGPGMLRVAITDDEVNALCLEWEWQQDLGLEMDYLSAKEAQLLEPSLSRQARLALRSPEERQVEPKRLMRSLALACARRGVRIIEGAPVTGFAAAGASIRSAESLGEEFECDTVVIAGGAWSRMIVQGFGASLPVYPIRGQILALSCLPPPMRHTIYTRAGYLVPKADGRVIVGATEDEAGFDARPNAYGMARLLNMAPALVPALSEAPFESAWAGLRPASGDGMPILGRLPGWENIYIAAGHFRNGILLTPITGEILAHEILQEQPHLLAAAFRPERFAAWDKEEDET